MMSQSIEETAISWGIDCQAFKIKNELVDTIRLYCKENRISKNKLILHAPTLLTKDQISKLFSGQVFRIPSGEPRLTAYGFAQT